MIRTKRTRRYHFISASVTTHVNNRRETRDKRREETNKRENERIERAFKHSHRHAFAQIIINT